MNDTIKRTLFKKILYWEVLIEIRDDSVIETVRTPKMNNSGNAYANNS